MKCEERSRIYDGIEDCCLHDLPEGDSNAPGRVCCWCGDIYLPPSDATAHGEYKPHVFPSGYARKVKR